MSSYELKPDNIPNGFPIGRAAGPPDYSRITNNGMEPRGSNNQFNSSVVGGKSRRRRRMFRLNKKKRMLFTKNKKRSLAKRSLAKRTLTKKKKHSHSSYNQSFLSRKRKSRSKNILRKLFFGRGEPPVGYTMDTKNTNTLHGAMATPYNMTGYQ